MPVCDSGGEKGIGSKKVNTVPGSDIYWTGIEICWMPGMAGPIDDMDFEMPPCVVPGGRGAHWWCV